MFVTAADFNIPPYDIPGLTGGVGTTFDAFVAQEERKYLLEVFGDNLYNAFINGLNALPGEWVSTVATVIGKQYVYGNDVWEALTVQTGTAPVAGADWTLIEEDNRWLLLKNGDYYMIYGRRYYWDGMVNAMKALIYSRWVELIASRSLTSNGFVIPAMENNIRINPNQYICRSWNDWSDRIGDECHPCNTLYGYLHFTNQAEGTFDDTFDETFQSFDDYLSREFGAQGRKNVFDI